MILVTGSRGLIGRRLVSNLRATGREVIEYDIQADAAQDTRDAAALQAAAAAATGIVHLAAISRVAWGERFPDLTWSTNVEPLKALLTATEATRPQPWVLFASSREVYGEGDPPVPEDAPLKPMNHYARSKVAGETLIEEARQAGRRTQICRFSNVFGSIDDHGDRVVPAFARAAAFGGAIRIDGLENTFDFTHVRDVSNGALTLVDALEHGELFPPVHFVSGAPTTLGRLAEWTQQYAARPVRAVEGPGRSFDVARFFGDPTRAERLLGWRATTSAEHGFRDLVEAFGKSRTKGEAARPAEWLEGLVNASVG